MVGSGDPHLKLAVLSVGSDEERRIRGKKRDTYGKRTSRRRNERGRKKERENRESTLMVEKMTFLLENTIFLV